jgi:hypothetical protein
MWQKRLQFSWPADHAEQRRRKMKKALSWLPFCDFPRVLRANNSCDPHDEDRLSAIAAAATADGFRLRRNKSVS